MELFDSVVAPLKVPNPPPVSINEDLILSCVRFEHAVRVEECRITGGNPDKRRDPGHLPDGSVICSQLVELNLSFRHIANMSSLQGLRALRGTITPTRVALAYSRTLRLDNNKIEVISGLEHLPNLRWLDLSFNKISSVEGLQLATELVDLNLSNNELTSVRGLEQLPHLEVLSMSNNALASAEDVTVLRWAPALRALAVAGNPFTHAGTAGEARSAVLARLPSLAFLDWSAVTPEEVSGAADAHRTDVDKLRREEAERDAQRAAAAQQQQLQKQHAKAGLSRVASLVEALASEDAKTRDRMLKLPDIPAIWSEFQQEASALAQDVIDRLSEVAAVLEDEEDQVEEALAAVRDRATHSARAAVDGWMKARKQLERMLEADEAPVSELHAKAQELRTVALRVHQQLLADEVEVHDTCTAILNEFESQYAELAAQRATSINALFRDMETCVTQLSDSLKASMTGIVQAVAEAAASGGGNALTPKGDVFRPSDLEQDVFALVQDRESTMAAVAAGHEVRLTRLYREDDEVKVEEREREHEAVEGREEAELVRHRGRVQEIGELVSAWEVEVKEMEAAIRQLEH